MEFIGRADNHKKGLGRLIHIFKEHSHRLCAVLLCISMVLGGFPASIFQAFALESVEEYFYEFEAESFYEAILAAISEGSILDNELYFTGKYSEQYEELFDTNGTLYELKDLKPNKDTERDKVLDLRIFVRIEGDIPLDGEYVADGSEPFIFLLINRSKDAVDAVICVDDLKTETIGLVPASSIPIEKESERISTEEEKPEISGGNAGSVSGGSIHNINDNSSESAEVPEENAENEAEEEPGKEISEDEYEEDISAEDEPPKDESIESNAAEDEYTGDEYTENESAENEDAQSESAENEPAKDESVKDEDIEDVRDASEKSDKNDDSDSADSDKVASISANHTGLLTLTIINEEILADAAEGSIVSTNSGEIIDDGSGSAVTIASASDAEITDGEPDKADEDTLSDNVIDGELYPAVLLDGKKTAVAFVTSAEELGLDKFLMTEDNEEIETNQVDAILGVILPNTGGPGSLPFISTGFLMISGASLIYLILRRRKMRAIY